jgi:hypothetical protein
VTFASSKEYVGQRTLPRIASAGVPVRVNIAIWKIGFAFVLLLEVGVSQSSHKSKSIVINGHAGDAVVYQIDGKSFLDLESLVRIGNGSMMFRGEQIVLTLPASDTAPIASDGDSHQSRLSAEFMKAAVQDLAIIKEWTSLMAYAVQRGVPGDGARLQVFHDRAAEGLRLATVAAQSNSDHGALTLLTNHFNTVSSWTDKLVRERRSMDTGKYSMAENALSKDETYQKISNCTNFLSTMLPAGSFHDDYSCH